MRKRIISISLALLLCMQSTALASFSDVDSGADYANAIERLSTLNIMNGNGDGSFNIDGYVTRAEMSKIAVKIADLDVQTSYSSLFSDMEEGNWANGYVNTIATNGIIMGYPDGTFQPDRNLTYAETITIILRLLGYGSKVLGNNYPEAYLEKAKQLSLTDGLYFNYNDYIDRKNAAIIFDRALLTDIYSSSSKKTKLIENLNYTLSEECIIIATNNESKELLSDEVVTSIGTYKKLNNDVDNYVTQTCKLILDKDKKITSVIPIQKQSSNYIIDSVTGNEISTDKGIIKMNSSSVVYFKNKKTTYSSIIDEIQTGTKMNVYYTKNGAYDYAVLNKDELLGPVIFKDTGSLSSFELDENNLRVIRDGKKSKLSALNKYDVLYYDKDAKILYSYCDKVSGIYEEAYPNKANVTSVKISGKKYTLETQESVESLTENSDSFKLNDYITALLGKDGKIAAIEKNSDADANTNYGVLISCSERVEDGTKKYYAKFLSSSGVEQEFRVNANIDKQRGNVARYIFENGILEPFFVNVNKISGSVNKLNKEIGNYRLTSDCKIIDLAYAPGKMYEYDEDNDRTKHDDLEDYPDAVAKEIDIAEITVPTLAESEVIDAEFDKNGDVVFLVLNNITMSRYKFGIVNKADIYSSNATYDINFGESSSTYSIEEDNSLPTVGDAVMADIKDNKLIEIRELDEIKTYGSFASIDRQMIKIGLIDYSLAKDAVVFLKTPDDTTESTLDYKYDAVSIDDMSDYTIGNIQLFIDKDLAKGGRVRVIVFTVGSANN
jgi:S-layer homology domain.